MSDVSKEGKAGGGRAYHHVVNLVVREVRLRVVLGRAGLFVRRQRGSSRHARCVWARESGGRKERSGMRRKRRRTGKHKRGRTLILRVDGQTDLPTGWPFRKRSSSRSARSKKPEKEVCEGSRSSLGRLRARLDHRCDEHAGQEGERRSCWMRP